MRIEVIDAPSRFEMSGLGGLMTEGYLRDKLGAGGNWMAPAAWVEGVPDYST
jgi:hypothetical protein